MKKVFPFTRANKLFGALEIIDVNATVKNASLGKNLVVNFFTNFYSSLHSKSIKLKNLMNFLNTVKSRTTESVHIETHNNALCIGLDIYTSYIFYIHSRLKRVH